MLKCLLLGIRPSSKLESVCLALRCQPTLEGLFESPLPDAEQKESLIYLNTIDEIREYKFAIALPTAVHATDVEVPKEDEPETQHWRRRSSVWNHFTQRSGSTKSECKYCGWTANEGSTLSMLRHLKAKHKEQRIAKLYARERPRTSSIWKHFTISNEFSNCKYCHWTTTMYDGSNTCMKRHFVRNHESQSTPY